MSLIRKKQRSLNPDYPAGDIEEASTTKFCLEQEKVDEKLTNGPAELPT
jgi:hypothetical protein